MEANGKKRECIEWPLAACMALLLLVTIWKVLGCFFETNDDRFIAEILSGTMGGVPEAHVIYVNYFISYPLAFLYRLRSQIPWYGLMLLLFQILVYTALLQSAWSRGKTMVERMTAVSFVGSGVLLNLYITSAVQYTSTAVLMAAAGYICLLLNGNPKRGWLLFCLFEGLAFLLRDQAMLMLQPMGLAVCASEFFWEAAGTKKEWLKKICCLASIAAAVIMFGLLGTFIGYRGEEWADFKRFNEARTEIFDFYGTPEYEEVKDILDQYGVSPTEYTAFRQYVLLNQNIGTECVEELAEYVRQTKEDKLSVSRMLQKLWSVRNEEEYFGVGRAALAACCAVLVLSLLRKRAAMLASLGALIISSMAVEGYLIYRGRMLLRVMLPLFCAEFLFAAVILLRSHGNRENKLPQYMAVCSAAVLMVICAFSGRMQYHSVRWEQSWQEYYTEGLVEVYEYCRTDPAKRYILEINSFADYRGNVLETRLAGEQNCAYSGSWLFHSPVMNAFLHDYLGDEEANICLVVLNNEFGEEHYAVAFLAEAMGEAPLLADKFSASNGTEYLVWEFGE